MNLQRTKEMPETVSKKTRWGLLVLMAAVFAAAAIAGNFYHPWDEVLENSAAGVLDFSKLEEASSVAGNDFWDRVDVMKAEIGRFLFADSAPGILNTAAHYILSPIEDTAKSISLAVSYADLFERSTPDPFVSALILIVYFLLFYGFEFGKNRILDRANAQNRVEQYVFGYCVEGAAAFLCLFVTHWMIMGLEKLRSLGIFQFFYGGISGDALVAIPSIIVLVAVLVFFVIMIISLFICVMPYYLMMALPVMLAAVLPVWMWMKLLICLALETVIIVKVFPWLFERLNLWNTVSVLTRIVLFVPRKILHLFTGPD